MKKKNVIYILTLLNVMFLLSSCSENDLFTAESNTGCTLILQLPQEQHIDITTRALSDENLVDELFVVLFRDGVAKFQSFVNPTITGSQIAITITDFSVNAGETVYVCCNTGITSMPNGYTDADNFFKMLSVGNSISKMPMYGSCLSEGTGLSISLERIFSKVKMTYPAGYTVSWKVCNVPSKGYVSSEQTGYPASATFDQTSNPDTDVAYFIPRTDNSSTAEAKTYILANIAGQGWYKLDFYDKDTPIGVDENAILLDIQRNTFYTFNIIGIKEKGYDTELEAAANDGCNIIYEMNVETDNGISNGQYSLLINRQEILCYPTNKNPDGTINNKNAIQSLEISAVVANPKSEISTYNVTLVTPSLNEDIKLLDDDGNEVEVVNLKIAGEKLTTSNSSRTIRIKCSGANIQDSHLIVKLGNIERQVPIRIAGANCYLADFSSAIGKTIYIPVQWANADGTQRISPSDNFTTAIIWTDQSNITETSLSIVPQQSKQWIEITNNVTFTGNVVIAMLKDGEIKWSWHLWCLDGNMLTWDENKKVYDFKPQYENIYNGYTFMDRNVGATTLNKDGSQTDWGLVYQWGRKDPFPGSADADGNELTIYHEGTGFTMFSPSGHPLYGQCIVDGSNSANNLEYSIQHPMQFIKGGTVSLGRWPDKDWYTNIVANRREDLWINLDGKKAVYNPCPIGWTLTKESSIGPWASLHVSQATTSDDHGIDFSDAGYFSYGNFRGWTGELDSSGRGRSILRLWWGKIQSNSILNGTEFSGTAIVKNLAVRSEAHHIRCVRE